MRPCTQPAQRSTTRRERDEELGRAGVLCVAATRLDPVLREVREEELVRQLILDGYIFGGCSLFAACILS